VVVHEVGVLGEIDGLEGAAVEALAAVNGFVLGGGGAPAPGLRTSLPIHSLAVVAASRALGHGFGRDFESRRRQSSGVAGCRRGAAKAAVGRARATSGHGEGTVEQRRRGLQARRGEGSNWRSRSYVDARRRCELQARRGAAGMLLGGVEQRAKREQTCG